MDIKSLIINWLPTGKSKLLAAILIPAGPFVYWASSFLLDLWPVQEQKANELTQVLFGSLAVICLLVALCFHLINHIRHLNSQHQKHVSEIKAQNRQSFKNYQSKRVRGKSWATDI